MSQKNAELAKLILDEDDIHSRRWASCDNLERVTILLNTAYPEKDQNSQAAKIITDWTLEENRVISTLATYRLDLETTKAEELPSSRDLLAKLTQDIMLNMSRSIRDFYQAYDKQKGVGIIKNVKS